MNDSATEGSASNGDAGPTTPEGSGGDTSSVNGQLGRTPLVRDAVSLIKQHPIGAVATLAVATAFLELELAVGILAGLGATALLKNESGTETRQRVFARGKRALDRARTVVAKVKSPPPPVAPPV